jgi:predicted alpha/beta-fold hydrolase
MLYHSKFKAAWWLSNPHLQTVAAKWLRRKESVFTLDETIELPDDDFVDIAWTERPDSSTRRPIVVILHGLEGSVDSHYAIGMLKAIKQQGWIGLLMHFRGCSGRPNRKGRSYHSGDTGDLEHLTSLLLQRYPLCPLSIVGFSLGGNVLTRYLAKHSNNPFLAAVVICAPLHLASCSKRINQGMSKFYQKYLLNQLKKSTQQKISLKLLSEISAQQVSNIKNMREFDQIITAPLNGFHSADDYYEQVSGSYVLPKIKQPCLLIHAADDPFLSHQHIVPAQALPETMQFEICRQGGHVGFITGNNPLQPKYWLEQRVPAYLAEHINDHTN